jgi:hypothetical protein
LIAPFARLLFGVMVFACHIAWAAEWDTAMTALSPGSGQSLVEGWRAEKTPWATALTPASNQAAGASQAQIDFEPLPNGGSGLSPAALRVSRIADRNGDRDFLMVDKVHGKIILFGNGRPIFSGSALTGESMADQLPLDALSKSWSQQVGVRYKVTPAGRFTITRGRDEAFGEIFDINELQGKDWIIAIHQVWLGRRSEHRDARLRSFLADDKHITDGCVDVEASTITQLLRLLPNRGVPLYILPIDEGLITTLFGNPVRAPGREATVAEQ